MAISIVDSADNVKDNTSPATLAVTLVGVQAGDAIVVLGVCEGTETISFADDRTNSYVLVQDVLHTGNFPRVRLMYALNCAAGDTVATMTLSAAQYRYMAAVALRSVKTSAAAEDDSSNQGTDTAQPSTGTITATSTGIIVAGFGNAGSYVFAPNTGEGWVELEEDESGTGSTGGLAYQLTTTGSYDADWTSGGTPGNWVAIGVQLAEISGPSDAVIPISTGRRPRYFAPGGTPR